MKPIVTKQRPTVLIATPSHDERVMVGYMVAVTNVIIARPFGVRIFVASRSGITKARNHCAYHLLNDFPEATHLFFWDSDIVPEAPVDALKALIERDVPVVGWLYSHKSENLKWCLNLVKPDGSSEGEEVNPINEGPLAGLLPVHTLGTGGMLVKREVFTTLIEKFGPELEYVEDQESDGGGTPKGAKSYAFFQELIENKRVLTEDWFFCRLCERAGIPMYVDVRFHVGHKGLTVFPTAASLAQDKAS